MKTIGQLVREARGEATLAKYAKTLKIGKVKLNQIERDQPRVITEENAGKLAAVGVVLPKEQLDHHNYVAAACRKAKNWSKDYRLKVEAGQLSLTSELQAASDAVDQVTEYPAKRKGKFSKSVAAAPTTLQAPLPNFLGQLNNARIEEMVAERIYQRLQAQIDARVDVIFGGGKKHG